MGKKFTKFDPTPEQKKAGLAHVAYEMELLLVASGTLGNTRDKASPQALICFEGVLLHARVLLAFFENENRVNRHGVECPDILASDYGFRVSHVHLDRSIRERLNKELAHLSYDRTNGVWDLKLLVPLLQRCLEFTESGPVRTLVPADQVKRWSDLRTLLQQALASAPPP